MPFTLNTIYSDIINLSLPPIAIILGFPLIDKLKNVKTSLGKFITHLSILSYAIYLTNMLIARIINNSFTHLLSENGMINYFVYWVLTLSSTNLLYIIIEKPIYKYGNKIFHTFKMMRENKTA